MTARVRRTVTRRRDDARGAFAGRTATLRLGFDSYVDVLEAGCNPEGGFLGVAFGNTNPSSLEVQ